MSAFPSLPIRHPPLFLHFVPIYSQKEPIIMKIFQDSRVKTPSMAIAIAIAIATVGCGDDGSGEGSGSTGEDSTSSSASSSTTMSMDSSSTTDPQTSSPTTDTDTDTDTEQTGTETTGPGICDQAHVELPGDDFFPEGTASDAEGTLYAASLANGSVARATPCQTESEELVPSGGPLRNPLGMIVDDANGWLIVCDSDFSFMAPPSIDVFYLDTGILVASHDFDAGGICNDLAIDGDGNVYATDPAGGRVMRVRADDLGRDTPAQTWATDPDFAVGMGEFGLNGIAYDDDASLYVVNYQQGELHRIAIEGNGDAGAITAITLDAPLVYPDGMKWMGDGELLVIEQGLSAISRITLDGDSASAEIVADGFDVPTTFALIDGSAWIAEGQLDHLPVLGGDGASEPPFVVTRVGL